MFLDSNQYPQIAATCRRHVAIPPICSWALVTLCVIYTTTSGERVQRPLWNGRGLLDNFPHGGPSGPHKSDNRRGKKRSC